MADLAFGAWAQTSIGAAITSRDTGAPDLGAATFIPVSSYLSACPFSRATRLTSDC